MAVNWNIVVVAVAAGVIGFIYLEGKLKSYHIDITFGVFDRFQKKEVEDYGRIYTDDQRPAQHILIDDDDDLEYEIAYEDPGHSDKSGKIWKSTYGMKPDRGREIDPYEVSNETLRIIPKQGMIGHNTFEMHYRKNGFGDIANEENRALKKENAEMAMKIANLEKKVRKSSKNSEDLGYLDREGEGSMYRDLTKRGKRRFDNPDDKAMADAGMKEPQRKKRSDYNEE